MYSSALFQRRVFIGGVQGEGTARNHLHNGVRDLAKSQTSSSLDSLKASKQKRRREH